MGVGVVGGTCRVVGTKTDLMRTANDAMYQWGWTVGGYSVQKRGGELLARLPGGCATLDSVGGQETVEGVKAVYIVKNLDSVPISPLAQDPWNPILIRK